MASFEGAYCKKDTNMSFGEKAMFASQGILKD